MLAEKRDAPADDGGGPSHPQKKFYRSRAHSNVLNANDFWFPASPSEVPWAEYFPERAAQGSTEQVEFVDVGCGYGSLLIALSRRFPENLMLGIEIRPKLVEYVQKRAVALRHEHQAAAQRAAEAAPGVSEPASLLPAHDNVWAIHNNAQRFMPNFFRKGQLTKIFICFPDPHFKRKNHRKRVISAALLAELAYCLRDHGVVYLITDVSELMEWMVGHLTASTLFERQPREQLKDDPVVPLLIATDEGLKVQRNNGNMFIAAFSKRLDPTAPREEPPLLGNEEAAAAAADAGYSPREGGELRGNTW